MPVWMGGLAALGAGLDRRLAGELAWPPGRRRSIAECRNRAPSCRQVGPHVLRAVCIAEVLSARRRDSAPVALDELGGALLEWLTVIEGL